MPSADTFLPPMRMLSVIRARVMSGLDNAVAADEEGVEIAQRVRQVLGFAVHDNRNGLLREAAVRTQRLIQSGKVMPRTAGSDHLRSRASARYHNDIAHAIFR